MLNVGYFIADCGIKMEFPICGICFTTEWEQGAKMLLQKEQEPKGSLEHRLHANHRGTATVLTIQ